MDVDTGGLQAGMAQELLDCEDIDPGFQKMRSKAMAQGMDGSRLLAPGFFLACLNTF